MDEPLYNCLKQMENASQGALFAIPQPASEAFKALNLTTADSWKLGCLLDMLIWFRDKTASAANTVYMQGRGD